MVREIEEASIQKVRSFNRTVAERIGAVSDRFLQRSRPMNEARLLWEIGHDGVEVRELRSRLGIDSGYLSRVLRSLERQGLVMTRADREDQRVRRASLTRAGLHERKELDRRSNELALSILEALSARQRDRLMTAMGEVERLLQHPWCASQSKTRPPPMPDGASTNILLSSTGALKAVLILGSASPPTHKN
jgi:DNA-binding MarR family transcriptional regulator